MATSLSRVEDILQTKIDGTSYDEPPQSRVEELLIELNTGGGGGGGTTNYNQLSNKPQVNGVTLSGNKTTADLKLKTSALINDKGFITASTLPVVPTDLSAFNNDVGFITEQDIPTGVSEFVNDAGYVTSDDVPSKTSDLTNDSDFVTETVMNTALAGKVNTSSVGTASGIAELDANGKVPSSQLPSYVDDVIDGYYKDADGKFYEESTYETEIPGEDGKIYISNDTDVQYRWTGSAFSALGGALVLGETSSTAYRGDRGKIAYDDSQTNKASIGDMSELTTTADDLVGAINEVSENIPDPITAGDGIDITNNVVSADVMPSADMSEIVTPLPSVQSRRMTYSTDEQIVGTWIDGKPLYQKTITGLNIQFTWFDKYLTKTSEIDPLVANVGTIIKIQHAIMTNNADQDIICNVDIQNTGTKWILMSIQDYYLKQITLQYTKTTD